MTRKYQLKRRAERQDETRRRIVEAAVALHTSIGPAQTSVSAIAEKAGVQRHTFYRHFPDERSLGLACSGLFYEQWPMPDPTSWREVADARQRLRRGLGELYAYYARHGASLAPIMRDAADHALTREIMTLRVGPVVAEMQAALLGPFKVRGKARARLEAALAAFMSFDTWRVLSNLPPEDALEAAVRAICAQVEG